MSLAGFGRAKFGGQKRNWFKLKDGDSVFRILPPIGDLQKDGRWSQFYRIHYGYKNSEGQMRTFQSSLVQNRKTKMIDVPDAALERIEQLKVKLEEAQQAKDSRMVEQLMKLVGGKKSRYNLDSNHYMNVIDLQGNIGILKIRHKAKLALDAAIKKLRDAGIEPLDPETGRYFVFTRSGMGRDTIYQVTVFEKEVTVPDYGKVKQEVVHVITLEIAERCFAINKDGSFSYREAARLDRLFKQPTAEEIERIVREGEKAVDEILDAKSGEESHDDSGMEDDETPTQATQPAATSTATLTPTPAPTQAPVATTPAPTPAPAAVSQPLAQTTAPRAATAPQTTAQAVAEQSDEDFLKSLGM